MKRILITGANSYIGTSFERYITENHHDEYVVDTVDMIDGSWREKSFEGYDTIFHVAGIAHQKETKRNASLYYEVNRDIAVEAAKKAKNDGVKQFIFLSSMSIYGMDTGVITKETVPNPKSHYGKSKWQAEQAIAPLADGNFKVCVIRPPMVYGKNCKGNYRTLEKLAKMLPVLPSYQNQRSMILIDRLIEIVKKCVDFCESEVLFPQDESYVCTSDMMAGIREQLGKRVRVAKWMNPLVWLAVKCTKKGRKAFGNLIYKDLDL